MTGGAHATLLDSARNDPPPGPVIAVDRSIDELGIKGPLY
jgi:hypothetical protein